MEIERIDDDTIKFTLSYIDMEARGFTREEVWNNREKSEELFWDMMDEVDEEIEFYIDGPLWIQVHAKSEGIEVIVTSAMSADGQWKVSPFDENDARKIFEQGEKDFRELENLFKAEAENEQESIENVFAFKEFEDVIRLASRMHEYGEKTSLYYYDEKYYLYVAYDEEQKLNTYSILTEFASPSKITIHLLEEYGKVIFGQNVFQEIEKHFK